MSFEYRWRCTWSGARMTMTSAHEVPSAGVTTWKPASWARWVDFEPSCRPMRTSTPESRRFCACGARYSTLTARPSILEDALGDGLRAATDREQSGLCHLLDAVGLEHAQERLGLARVAGDLDHECVGRDIHHPCAEQVHGLQHLGAGRIVHAHLDEQVFALHGLGLVELDDLDHVDQLVELLGDLLERSILDVDDHGDAREAGHLAH